MNQYEIFDKDDNLIATLEAKKLGDALREATKRFPNTCCARRKDQKK